MSTQDRLVTAAWLGVLAFLGFYVFGLVMGVYAPGEVLYFTIPAVVLAALYAVHMVRARRAARNMSDESRRKARRQSEARGF